MVSPPNLKGQTEPSPASAKASCILISLSVSSPAEPKKPSMLSGPEPPRNHAAKADPERMTAGRADRSIPETRTRLIPPFPFSSR